MKAKNKRLFSEAIAGQAWDLDGTIVLTLGPGVEGTVRCLTLDDALHEEPDDDGPVSDWSLRWFDGRTHYPSRRLA